MDSDLKKIASEIFRKTLLAIKPEKLILKNIGLEDGYLKICEDYIPIHNREKFYVIGAGKASARMAVGLEQVLGDRIRDGLIISPQGVEAATQIIQIFEGAHPKPDYHTLASSIEMLNFVRSVPKGAKIIALFSGGASSLFEIPAGEIELSELRLMYDLLLKSGAGIHEMNTVRKSMSLVKGGNTLGYLNETNVFNVLISDVPGDNPSYIGSGPTVLDTVKPEDALNILKKYDLIPHTPESVIRAISTLKPLTNTSVIKNYIIGTSKICAETAGNFASDFAYEPNILKDSYDITAEDLCNMITGDLKKAKGKKAYIYHGESMVKVTGDGKGGRNQHVALLMSEKLSGKSGVCLLSAGTDGRDGPTDAAGALVDGTTIQRAEQLGMKLNEYINRFDSYHYFKSLNDLIFTGPSGNNLMDLQILLTDL